MADQSVQLNLVPNDPQLRDLLNLHKKDILLGLNCHAVATVKSFNPANQTASASINYKKTFFQKDQAGNYVPTTADYPLMLDCPDKFLGGGGCVDTYPVAPGDECLVLFNDRDIDNWFQGGSGAAVATGRLHAFPDAILLVGLRSLANVVPDFDPTNPQKLVGGLTVTYRKAGGFRVENAIGWWDFKDDADVEFDTGTVQGLFGHGGHVKFKNATAELIDTLIQVTSAVISAQCASPGNPLVAPTLPALLVKLQSFLEP